MYRVIYGLSYSHIIMMYRFIYLFSRTLNLIGYSEAISSL